MVVWVHLDLFFEFLFSLLFSGRIVLMSTPVSATGNSELDLLRAELLRQKIIFEAELRRQRELYDHRFEVMSQQLRDRETDCRNLQAVVTILGKKVDTLQECLVTAIPRMNNSGVSTPRRVPSPARSEAAGVSPFRRQPSPLRPMSSNPSLQPQAFVRKDSTTSVTKAPSLNGLGSSATLTGPNSRLAFTGQGSTSRASSPGRGSTTSATPATSRPRVGTSRTTSGSVTPRTTVSRQ